MDFKSLRPGSNFVKQIVKTIGSCKALIVFIGPKWINSLDERNKKIEDSLAEDYVMIEIAAAINIGIPVIPLLLDGAKMPREKEIPDDLKAFAKHHAFEISTKRWQYDVKSLIAALKDLTGGKWKSKALVTAGGTGAVAGATGTNALLGLLGAAGLKASIPLVIATVPTLIVAGGGLAGYFTYKGVKSMLNKV
jgi:hypothetical protein